MQDEQIVGGFPTELALERICSEDSKILGEQDYDYRSHFAKDSARILHSAALRKLADKTQVVSPGEGNTPRNRLTHSLEVAQIGKSLAQGIGCDPELVELAGLAHDIGHPPFGHNGEKALAEYMSDAGGFEANAQNIRVLMKLEPKILSPDGQSVGLNLTRAALNSCIKYPWSYSQRQGSKYGAYDCDIPILEWIRLGAESSEMCLEAQIMNFADDVAYSVHDIEDGILSGRVNFQALKNKQTIRDLAVMQEKLGGSIDREELWEAAGNLAALPIVQELMNFDESFSAIVALKTFTSEMVGRFVTAAISSSRAAKAMEQSVQNAFRVPPNILAEVILLKNLALEYIMTNTHHVYKQQIEREILHELADKIEMDARLYLQPHYYSQWNLTMSSAEQKRIIADFLASLSEKEIYTLLKTSN